MRNRKLNIKILYRYFDNAIKEGLSIAGGEYEVENKYFLQHYESHKNMASLKINSNGIPLFNNDRNAINYERYFRDKNGYHKIKSWDKFKDYFLKSNTLIDYYVRIKKYNENDLLYDYFRSHLTYGFLSSIIDNYIHRYKTNKYNKLRVKKYFELWMNRILSEKLEVELWVPLIGVKLDVNNFKINESISLMKIPDRIQKARLNEIDDYSFNGIQKRILGAATHAIVLRNWSITNLNDESYFYGVQGLNLNKEFKHNAEVFIGLLYIFDDIKTGYFQVSCIPKNWSYGYKAELSIFKSKSIRNYPIILEKTILTDNIPIIGISELRILKRLFKKISKAQMGKVKKKKIEKIKFCLRKLHQAGLREHFSDSIIDISIILESLLTNDSKSEITYRQSTRATYLCILFPLDKYKTVDVKVLISKLYKLRSCIVHGGTEEDQNKLLLQNHNGKKYNILEFAYDICKHILKHMILNEKLQDFKVLEEKILKTHDDRGLLTSI